MPSRQVFLYVALLLLGNTASVTAAQTLSLVTAALPPISASENHPGFVSSIAKEAFDRIGVQITTRAIPPERALQNANAGIDDGDMLRIGGLEKHYPHLIPIPEPVMYFGFTAFTLSEAFPVHSLDDLKHRNVSFARGWKFYEHNVRHAHSVTRTENLDQLFGLLKLHRTDIALAERWQGLWAARNQGIQVYAHKPPLKVAKMYIYLHRSHAELVPKVAQAIREMKQDGTFARIERDTLGTLNDQLHD